MTVPISVLVYLMVFRVAVVGAGVVSLVLGYMLLVNLAPAAKSAGHSEIDASLPGVRLKLKNTAPGTAFAIFGAALIVTMVVRDAPSVTLNWLRQANSATQSPTSDAAPLEGSIQMRGSADDQLVLMTRKAENLERHGDKAAALARAHAAVQEIADPINDLAWSYYEAGKGKEALQMATIATHLAPDNPAYADTLAKITALPASAAAKSNAAQ